MIELRGSEQHANQNIPEVKMRKLTLLFAVLAFAAPAVAQNLSGLFPDLTEQQSYVLKRVSS